MKKQPYIAGRPKQSGSSGLGRMDSAADDERPFEEIRKPLHSALRMLSLHRWAFFVPFTTVTCAAFILSLYYPRTYQASTSFERRDDPIVANLPASASTASFKHLRKSMVRDLTSIECMRTAVENLGLAPAVERDELGEATPSSQRRLDSVARSMASTLNVTTTSPTEQLDVVRITYTGPDPSLGAKLVDEVKRTYIRQTMDWIHQELVQQRDYFAQRLEEASNEVKAHQREEIRLRMENPHVDPANPGTVTLKLAQLEMEHRELLLRQREYKAELLALRQMLAATTPPEPTPTTPPANLGGEIVSKVILGAKSLALSSQIRDLDLEVKRLRTTRGMTDQHPDIVKLMERRQWLEDEFQQQRALEASTSEANQAMSVEPNAPAADTPSNQPWQTERARLLAQIAGQESKIKDVEISLATNESTIEEIRTAKDEVFSRQEEFADVTGLLAQSRQKQRQIETTLASIEPAITAIEEGRLLHFSEGEPARGGSRPISPKAAMVVLMALLAGLATGVVFVMIAEIFDHVFRSSGQVAKALDLPVLESIDEIDSADERRQSFVRRAMLSPMVILCFVVLTGFTGSMAYLSIEQPSTYQQLRKIPEAAMQLFTG